MDAALRIMLVHTVGIRRLDVTAGYSALNVPTYAAGVNARAYVEQRRLRDTHPAGSHGSMTATVVTLEDAVTKDDLLFMHGVSMTDTDNGKQPTDVAIFYEIDRVDSSGNPIVSHYEVTL